MEQTEPSPPCSACDEPGAGFCRALKRWLCVPCEAELTRGEIPPMAEITGRRFNVPRGMSITRINRAPGAGEGNDYFGNHT